MLRNGHQSAPVGSMNGAGKRGPSASMSIRSEEHTSELQSRLHLVCRLLLEKKKKNTIEIISRYTHRHFSSVPNPSTLPTRTRPYQHRSELVSLPAFSNFAQTRQRKYRASHN